MSRRAGMHSRKKKNAAAGICSDSRCGAFDFHCRDMTVPKISLNSCFYPFVSFPQGSSAGMH